MIHDLHEDLPKPRTPYLGQSALLSAAATATSVHQSWPIHELSDSTIAINRTDDPSAVVEEQPTPRGNPARVRLGNIKGATNSQTTQGTNSTQEDDSASINSFKTCPSEPSLHVSSNFVPRQVSDSYETRVLGPKQPQQQAQPPRFSPGKVITRANSYAADRSPRSSGLEQQQRPTAPPKSRQRSGGGSGGPGSSGSSGIHWKDSST